MAGKNFLGLAIYLLEIPPVSYNLQQAQLIR